LSILQHHHVFVIHKQVQFQHTELVSKSSKVNGLRNDLEEQQKKESNVIATMKTIERQRRATMKNAAASPANDDTVRSPAGGNSLQQELESEHYDMDIFLSKLPRWMHQSAILLEEQASQLHLENERVSKLLIGYQQLHSAGTDSGNNNSAARHHQDATHGGATTGALVNNMQQ
jgi:hypothetical protein